MACLYPQVYVLKRPYVDEFIQRMGEMFECVLFTASLAKVTAAYSLYYTVVVAAVRGPCGGSAGQMGRLQRATVSRKLCFSSRKLREGASRS